MRKTLETLSTKEREVYVARVVGSAPNLSLRQRDRLANMLRGSLAAVLVVMSAVACVPEPPAAPVVSTVTTVGHSLDFPDFAALVTGQGGTPLVNGRPVDPMLTGLGDVGQATVHGKVWARHGN